MLTITCEIHNESIIIFEPEDEYMYSDKTEGTIIFCDSLGKKYLKKYTNGRCDEDCPTINQILTAEIIDPIENFNVNDFLFGLMGEFTPLMDYSNILIFYPMIADFARAKNFEGMKYFLQQLMAGSIMTQEQFDKLNSVLLQQNIDLTNLL